jgi:uncharacterized membrane protein YhiD involved in acid resistance
MLVRFRTNIRDPKEITVLLISLALGLSAGVGRWELGIGLCVFALALLWLLEYNEAQQVFRSMELTIKSRHPEHTREVVKKLMHKYKLDSEVREFEPPDEKSGLGTLVYYLNLRLNISTDHLSSRIMRLDPKNIEGISWSQKKKAAPSAAFSCVILTCQFVVAATGDAAAALAAACFSAPWRS